MTIGTDFVLSGATVANPAGTISIDCPITSIGNGTYLVTYNCSGGSFSYQSNDGTTRVSASFGTAAAYLSASGGGRGGNIHYYYTFSGNFSGTQTVNGVTGAIRGETKQTMQPVSSRSGSAPACCGSAGINSAYTPVYITDYSFSRSSAPERSECYHRLGKEGWGRLSDILIFQVSSAGPLLVSSILLASEQNKNSFE